MLSFPLSAEKKGEEDFVILILLLVTITTVHKKTV